MLLEVCHLTKRFKRHGVLAVDDVSFSIAEAETIGIIGESGSGKSTLAKLVMKLLEADAGEINFQGRRIDHLKEGGLKDFRKKTQIIFQHPFLSLDPRMKVADILREPFLIHGDQDGSFLDAKVRELLSAVELPEHFTGRVPSQLSGGECQRVAIARAVSMDPAILVCDEAVSALDVLVGAQILNLLLKLQREKRVSYLFISHDWKVVRHMSDRILLMKDGKVTPCKEQPYTVK